MNRKTKLWTFWIIFCLIYVGGFLMLNQWVRESCTHVACIHGWDSKETLPQRAATIAFLVIMPIIGYVLSRKYWGSLRFVENIKSDARSELGWMIRDFIRKFFD